MHHGDCITGTVLLLHYLEIENAESATEEPSP
jgi:hypothetical protein